MDLVRINPAEYGLQETKAKEIELMFTPMLEKMSELETEFNEVVSTEISKELCKKAKELRLKYVKVRTGTAQIHKDAKDFFLKGGKFVDGWKNAQLFASQGIESKLEEIEKYFENIELERMKALKESRIKILSEYSDIFPNGLEVMEQDVFENYLNGIKIAYELRIESEKKAQEERQKKIGEEKAEQERIKAENEILKQKQEQELKERQRLEQEKRKLEEENQKLEEEKRQQEIKEKQKQEQEEILKQKELNKSDKEKLIKLATDLIEFSLPELTNQESINILESTKVLLKKTSDYILNKSNSL